LTQHQEKLNRISALLIDAGQTIIMPAFSEYASTNDVKEDGSVVTETDLACQQYISTQLAAAWPDIGFLGEEMTREGQLSCLHSGESFWCLDPLDGTSNFIASFPAFALSLALIEKGRPTLGCIVDPVRKETFSAAHGQGAFLNNAPINARSVSKLNEAIGFVDFKRLDANRRGILSTPGLYRSQRNIGTCALEWAWLAAGRGQFIIHGGEKIWDFAAGSLIAAEAGCTLTDFSGKPLFEELHPASSILASASENLHETLLHFVRT